MDVHGGLVGLAGREQLQRQPARHAGDMRWTHSDMYHSRHVVYMLLVIVACGSLACAVGAASRARQLQPDVRHSERITSTGAQGGTTVDALGVGTPDAMRYREYGLRGLQVRLKAQQAQQVQQAQPGGARRDETTKTDDQ